MQLSARNQLPGRIVGLKKGQTTAHVRIAVSGGTVITSSITNEAVDELDLKIGDDVFAIIKSSDVMIWRATGTVRLKVASISGAGGATLGVRVTCCCRVFTLKAAQGGLPPNLCCCSYCYCYCY